MSGHVTRRDQLVQNAWISDDLNLIVQCNGHVLTDERGVRRSPGSAAQPAWIDYIKDDVSVLTTNIVDKEFKKIGISADGGVVKVSTLQVGLVSRNSP